MAEFQALTIARLTFNDVHKRIMEKIIRKINDTDEVHIFVDRYSDCGINPKQQKRFEVVVMQ